LAQGSSLQGFRTLIMVKIIARCKIGRWAVKKGVSTEKLWGNGKDGKASILIGRPTVVPGDPYARKMRDPYVLKVTPHMVGGSLAEAIRIATLCYDRFSAGFHRAVVMKYRDSLIAKARQDAKATKAKPASKPKSAPKPKAQVKAKSLAKPKPKPKPKPKAKPKAKAKSKPAAKPKLMAKAKAKAKAKPKSKPKAKAKAKAKSKVKAKQPAKQPALLSIEDISRVSGRQQPEEAQAGILELGSEEGPDWDVAVQPIIPETLVGKRAKGAGAESSVDHGARVVRAPKDGMGMDGIRPGTRNLASFGSPAGPLLSSMPTSPTVPAAAVPWLANQEDPRVLLAALRSADLQQQVSSQAPPRHGQYRYEGIQSAAPCTPPYSWPNDEKGDV